ncbi:MAG: RIP metalloprotease RseP, partial [Gammaproteobacteria bacterium]|nr:RIP metalloprotease RseP [Gammaproteobacteria bacterium]
MQLVYSILSFVVALGILVVVHEFGHYWVARKVGVKVLRFSVGFGKPLWSKVFGTDRTELVVAAIPLGGYVKMLDETEGRVAPEEAHRAFNRQTVWKRSLVVIAGPLFNFVFAILAYWMLFSLGVEGIKPMVGKVKENSYASQLGFKPGDELIGIDGMSIQTWDQHGLYLMDKALSGGIVVLDSRDSEGVVRTREIDLGKLKVGDVVKGSVLSRGLGLYPEIPDLPAVVGQVLEGPAKEAGLLTGDKVIEVSGEPIHNWRQLVEAISQNPGKDLSIKVDRLGEIIDYHIVPAKVDDKGKSIGRINITPPKFELPEEIKTNLVYSPGAALSKGLEDTWRTSKVILKVFYRMLRLDISSENISGPITIAQYAGYTAQIGLDTFLMFLAFISISLGVINLLPIPILDGGHLMYYLIEAIKGSPVSEQVMLWGQQVGII